MAHLDDATALAFAAGALDAAALAAAIAHVDGCADCRRLVAAAAGGGGPPTMIGRFVVEGEAGRGAMGVVYRARDPQLDRPVAIKMLREAAWTDAARVRFDREARALARVDHPNVVRVYEVGEHDGALYLAMELVDGDTLAAWLAAPRRVDAIVAAFAQAGEGLLAAHQAGLVHRDFKPANAMRSDDGRVRVADFGLALIEPAAPTTVDSAVDGLTRTGALVGTPAYLAPELLAAALDGGVGVAEPRSDQFSFCVALFEALAGHRPFAAPDLRALHAAIVAGPQAPARPVPRAVHRALRRGLAVDPHARFPSMRELLDAIAPPARRGVVIGVVASLAAAGAAAGYVATRPSPRVAVVAPVDGEACPAAAARWDAVGAPARLTAARAAVVAAWPSRPPPDVAPAFAARWDGLGRVRGTLVYVGLKRYGEQWRSRYREVCTGDSADRRRRRSCLDGSLDYLDALLADPPGAAMADELRGLERDLDRCASHLVGDVAVPRAEAQAAADEARRALIAGKAARARGDHATADAQLTVAQAAAERAVEASTLAEVWFERGQLARARGDDEAAIEAWRTGMDHAQRVHHLAMMRPLAEELAAAYARTPGQTVEARRWLRTSETLDGQVPPSDAERALRLLARAELARDAGDLDAARGFLTEAEPLAGGPGGVLERQVARVRASLTPAP